MRWCVGVVAAAVLTAVLFVLIPPFAFVWVLSWVPYPTWIDEWRRSRQWKDWMPMK